PSWSGSRLVVADRFYPSSKTCSACGWVKAKLTLAERTFTCEGCGLRLDRDLNGARNHPNLPEHGAQSAGGARWATESDRDLSADRHLAKLAEHVAQSGWETLNARGADRKTQPDGQVA